MKISADLPNADLVLNSKRGSRSGLETRDVRRAEIAGLSTCIRINGKMRRQEECGDIPTTIRYNAGNLQNKQTNERIRNECMQHVC